MSYTFQHSVSKSFLRISEASLFKQSGASSLNYYTFIWSQDTEVTIELDLTPITIQPQTILALTPTQHLTILNGDARIIQFNRELYCIKDHDKEVGCMGLLFFGDTEFPKITLTNTDYQKFKNLYEVFVDEIQTSDNSQIEMLRTLTAQLLIKITRLHNNKSIHLDLKDEKKELIRKFNILVHNHFQKEHSVAFYARQLNISPKTLSNYFGNYKRSPLRIIHERIILEAKRLLTYTDKSAKEIAFEVGFHDPSHLSRLFKKHTSTSPSKYRKSIKYTL